MLLAAKQKIGIIGPPVFGTLYGYFISPQAPINLPGSPFLLAALLMTTSIILASRVTRGLGRPTPSQDFSIPNSDQGQAGDNQAPVTG